MIVCRTGFALCPEAVRLWQAVRCAYSLAAITGAWAPYEARLAEYYRHEPHNYAGPDVQVMAATVDGQPFARAASVTPCLRAAVDDTLPVRPPA